MLAAVVGAPAGSYAGGQNTLLDARGEPLPFENDGELLEFLRTADVVSEKDIGVGINKAKKLLLDKDGVQAHAIFRQVNIREDFAR